MIIYKFIKYLRLYIKYAKTVIKVFKEENLMKSFSYLFGSEFRMDWVGRVYTVLNPMVQNIEDLGSSVAVYEFTQDGGLSNKMWIEKWIMDRLYAAQQFIQSNNLFDVMTYEIKKLDNNENYLFVLKPLYFEDVKKWTKRFSILLGSLAIIGIALLIIL